MRRFVALSLSFFILLNSMSNFAFADPVKVTASSNLIRTKVIKLAPGLISDDNEDIYAIRLIQVEAISPENLPLRSRIVTKLENRPGWSIWSAIKDIIWDSLGPTVLGTFATVIGACIGSGVMKLAFGASLSNAWIKGAFAGPIISKAYRDIKTWWGNRKVNKFRTYFSKIPVDVVLIPISEKAAKILSEKYVYVGEMKQPLIDYENQIKAINAENGISDADDLKIKLWQKAKNGLYDPIVDRYDPYNLVGTGKIFNIKPEVSSRNPNDFYNKKETEEKNTKIDQEQNKVLTGLKKIMDEELIDPSNFKDNSWNLTKKNPILYFLVAAVNCREKADALKLSLKRRLSYPNPLTMDKLLFNFGANIDFDASDNKKYEEILAELSDSWVTYYWKKFKNFLYGEKQESTEEESVEEVHFAQNSDGEHQQMDPEWALPESDPSYNWGREDQETQADFGINEGIQVNPRTAPRYRDAEAGATPNQNNQAPPGGQQQQQQNVNDDSDDEDYTLGRKNPFP